MTDPIAVDDWLVRDAADATAPEPAGELTRVPTARLRVDPTYQRGLSKRGRAVIRRMVADFRWDRFGALTVAAKADHFAVIDGQHRALAAAALGIETVPAIVFDIDTPDAAGSFLGINSNRTAVGPMDKFRAALAAGDPAAAELADMLADLNLDWNAPPSGPIAPGQIRCITRLSTLIRHHGRGIVETALDAMIRAQPDQPDWLIAALVDGTTRATETVLDVDGTADPLVPVLADIDPETLLDEARTLVRLQGGGIAQTVADRILTRWRESRRARRAAER